MSIMGNLWERFNISEDLGDKVAELQRKRIMIVGSGGLGSEIAIRIAGCRIGHIVLVDGDKVEKHNTPHSTVFLPEDVGCYKTEVVKEVLKKKYPRLNVESQNKFIQQLDPKIFEATDFIVCAPDNDQTRLWVNYFAVRNSKASIFVGISGPGNEWSGYVFAYKPGRTACFLCLASGGERIGSSAYDRVSETDNIRAARKMCGGSNVPVPLLSPVVGLAANLVALATIKECAGVGKIPNYTFFNAKDMQLTSIEIKPSKDCDTCSGKEEVELTRDALESIKRARKK